MDWKEKIRDLKQQFEEFWEPKNIQRGAAAEGRRPPFVGAAVKGRRSYFSGLNDRQGLLNEPNQSDCC